MTGMKVAGGVALGSGGLATLGQVVDPKDLGGLGPTQLATLVSLVAIGALVFIVLKFIPVILKLVTAISTLIAKMEERPCIGLKPEKK